MKTKEHLITDYFMSIVTAKDKKLFLENTVCIKHGLWMASLSHCVLHKSTQSTANTPFSMWMHLCISLCASHSLKLLHSNFRHVCAWNRSFRNYRAPIKSEWRDVLGLSGTGALVRLKTKFKRITFNVNANHICYGVWNISEDICSHWSYLSRNISLWQQLQTVTQFCTTLKDSHRVQEGHFH